MSSSVQRLEANIRSILTYSLPCKEGDEVLVIYDEQVELCRSLLVAYKAVVPYATFLSFDEEGPEVVKRAIDRQNAGALVVLIQTSSFRLDAFRIRLELFRRGIRTIEHPHLGRLETSQEVEYFIDSLAYDSEYYRGHGIALSQMIREAKQIRVVSHDGSVAVYQGPFEEPKKNTGDYREMQNVGGTFPIGEVFTELVDLSGLSGTFSIFGYGGMDFRTRIVTPFTVKLEKGILVDSQGAPEEFEQILQMVRDNESAHIRELGFGLNRAFSKERVVSDITTFERQLGLHVSLGEKHAIYPKEGMKPKHTKYHIDLFVDVSEVWFDDYCGFKEGNYQLANYSS